MNILLSELLCCMYADDKKSLTGFDMKKYENVMFDEENAYKNLIEEELFEFDEKSSKYSLSALGEFYINVINDADVWLVIKNNIQDFTRRVYIKDEYYIYLDEVGDRIIGDVLPVLPIVFGGCAKMLEIGDGTADNEILIEGFGKSGDADLLFEVNSDNKVTLSVSDSKEKKDYDENSLLNSIVQWIIGGLKDIDSNEMEEVINE